MTTAEPPTYIAAAALGFSFLSSELPKGLLVGRTLGLADFLISGEGNPFAICLDDGPLKFEAFSGPGKNERYAGFHISGVDLRVDVSSAYILNRRDIWPGDLVIDQGSIFIAAKPTQMGHMPRLVQWGATTQLGDGTFKAGFSRWQVVQRDPHNGQLQVLTEITTDN